MNTKFHMNPVNFDSIKKIDYLGYILFVTGLIALGVIIFNSWQTSELLAKKKLELDRYQSSLASIPINEFDVQDPQIKEINEIIHKQMNFPWRKLFSTLEKIHTRDVSLMTIQPNIDTNEVLISAKTLNTHLMHDYIRVLGMHKNIHYAELLRHEASIDKVQEKITFSIRVKLN